MNGSTDGAEKIDFQSESYIVEIHAHSEGVCADIESSHTRIKALRFDSRGFVGINGKTCGDYSPAKNA